MSTYCTAVLVEENRAKDNFQPVEQVVRVLYQTRDHLTPFNDHC